MTLFLFVFLNSEIFCNILQGCSYGLVIMPCEVLTLHLTAEGFVQIRGNPASKVDWHRSHKEDLAAYASVWRHCRCCRVLVDAARTQEQQNTCDFLDWQKKARQNTPGLLTSH